MKAVIAAHPEAKVAIHDVPYNHYDGDPGDLGDLEAVLRARTAIPVGYRSHAATPRPTCR
ncbi:MAG: hypothetical protein VB093_12175 [Propionicimonas sp.]|nr:hypothetical protein [Propionicimonas sp.]